MAKPDLTIRERKLIKGVLSGLSGAEAARRAGYSPRSAKEIASETLTKPNVQSALEAAMEKAGITDEKLADVIKEGLAADKVVAHVVSKDGLPDLIERPDHAVRHKFAETAIDVKGAKAARKVQVSGFDDLLNTIDDDPDGDTEEGPSED